MSSFSGTENLGDATQPRGVSSLTTLLAEYKEELSRTVLYISVNVSHQAHKLVPQQVPHLRAVLHIPERRQHLQTIVRGIKTEQPGVFCSVLH